MQTLAEPLLRALRNANKHGSWHHPAVTSPLPRA